MDLVNAFNIVTGKMDLINALDAKPIPSRAMNVPSIRPSPHFLVGQSSLRFASLRLIDLVSYYPRRNIYRVFHKRRFIAKIFM